MLHRCAYHAEALRARGSGAGVCFEFPPTAVRYRLSVASRVRRTDRIVLRGLKRDAWPGSGAIGRYSDRPRVLLVDDSGHSGQAGFHHVPGDHDHAVPQPVRQELTEIRSVARNSIKATS